ncbi:hypothetical protein [Microbacterium sp. T2.11-28]|uniref:hypothetical protein n=1 Tax=Microbacterium sp. T2.11-28 TaxID=3041169 RepID=UPI0024774622|nr:hypothetical protein [Microbacterium sp. T2.11-28]CAI9394000.1 hypothetical protein MICABA_02641 [Microbacterium sp. T2.11-28]
MPEHYVKVTYECRNGFTWDLIATVTQQVHVRLRAAPPTGVAGAAGRPAGACDPPSAVRLTELVTAELHSSRHPEHIRRGSVLIRE